MPIIIPAYTGIIRWNGPTSGQFRPNGKLRLFAAADAVQPNPATWHSAGADTLAARLFVGFNVGGKPTWDLEDLVAVVRKARERQHQKPDASFVAQKGIYTHTTEGKRPKVIEEEGAQIVIIRMPGEKDASFRKHMIGLAETVADTLDQAEVVLELQRGGVVQEVMGVTA